MSEPLYSPHAHSSRYFSGADSPVYVNRFDDDSHPGHDHDFVEIGLVTRGSTVHRTMNGNQLLQSGDAFIVRPGTWHAFEEGRNVLVLNICFGVELLGRELVGTLSNSALHQLFWAGSLSSQRRGIVTLQLPPQAIKECRCHHHEIDIALHGRNAFAGVTVLGRLLLLMGILGNHLNLEQENGSRPQRVHEAVKRGIELLEARPAHPWTLEELAAQVHLDRFYLSRLFKAQTGLAPMTYLSRARAERAATFLLRTDWPLSLVAHRVGWNDAEYFAQRFKAHFGLSAREYRRRFQDESAKSEGKTPAAPIKPPNRAEVQTPFALEAR